MIQKIMPKLATQKLPNRALLQRSSIAGLALLAGSSMSGWHGPNLEPTEMVIPGGLGKAEKAYFLLKGKLPRSVYERWIPNDSNYVPQNGDQVVIVNMGGGYVGKIVQAPHDIATSGESLETLNQDIVKDVIAASVDNLISVDPNDENSLTFGEFWEPYT